MGSKKKTRNTLAPDPYKHSCIRCNKVYNGIEKGVCYECKQYVEQERLAFDNVVAALLQRKDVRLVDAIATAKAFLQERSKMFPVGYE